MKPAHQLPKFAVLVLLAVLMGSVLACERRQASLLGTWQSASGETFEFSKDGAVRMKENAGGQIFSGTYRLLDANRLAVEFSGTSGTAKDTFVYTISGENLTLKSEAKGQTIAYRRVAETMATSSGLAKQLSEAPRQQPSQPQVQPPVPSVPPVASPPQDSFTQDEETPQAAPPQPTYAPPAPRPAPPPQRAWGGRWPWTADRYIQPDELWALSLWELELMRNEIYARHGWVFNRKDLRDYFFRQPWYSPKGDLYNREQANRWAQAELTPVEKRNIQIIVSRERDLKR